MHVTACGGANLDTIALLEGAPERFSGEFKIRDTRRSCGGSAANFACAMSKLGRKTFFVGCVGKDREASEVKSNFKKFGVDTALLQEDTKKGTGHVFIFSTHTDTMMFSSDGANMSLSTHKIDKERLLQSELIFVSKTRWEVASFMASFARRHNIPLSFDPGRMATFGEEKLNDLLEKTDFLFPNEREVFLLTGKQPEEGTAELSSRVGLCVTKIGKRGCLVGKGGSVFHVEGFCVPSLDTTGAGDIFDASYLFSHLSGKGMLESALFANASAALSTTRVGGMSCFSLGSIKRFMKKTLNEGRA